MNTAQQYADCQWYCSASNANSEWNDYVAGTNCTGVAYNWGGMDSIAQFLAKISQGAIAGSQHSGPVHSEFAGIDCSGFVLRCWGYTTHAYSTASLYRISDEIAWADLKPGDVLNLAGSHVRLFEQFDASDPNKVWVYESTTGVTPGRVVHRYVLRSSMEASGYIPRRFVSIQDPNPPTPTAPGAASAPGPVVSTLAPTFTWSAATGATGYGLYILDVGADTLVYPNVAGVTATPLTGTSLDLPTGFLQAETQYSWTMSSFVGTTEMADRSAPFYFTTSTPQPPHAPGDFDLDNDVDQDDFGHLQVCLSGTGVAQTDPACQDAKLAGRSWVDDNDVAVFRRCLSGANNPADPNCAN